MAAGDAGVALELLVIVTVAEEGILELQLTLVSADAG